MVSVGVGLMGSQVLSTTALRLLEAGMRRSEQRLQEFEGHYGLSTADFIQRYEHDELEETLEFAEWIGEYRLKERLLEKADILRAIRFAN